MRLGRILSGCDCEVDGNSQVRDRIFSDMNISGIAYDSRKVDKDNMFVAIKGGHDDGRSYIADAVGKGAAAVVYEGGLGSCQDEICGQGFRSIKDREENTGVHDRASKAVFIRVQDSRKALACLSNNFYERPSEGLFVIGVTGTNGKTTTTYLIRSIIDAWHKDAGLIGTISYLVRGREYPAFHTTPEAVEFQGLLKEMLSAGCGYAVAEVSSHSLSQRRVDYTRFSSAVFTNLTRDHLDFHGTMERYYEAKKRLFTELLADHGTAVINIDDPWGKRLLNEVSKEAATSGAVITYGIDEGADVRAANIQNSYSGVSFVLRRKDDKDVKIESPLLGLINVYNILAAASACLGLNMPPDAIAKGINNLRSIKGRFESIDAGQDFLCIIDYAHTHDALERLISTAKALVNLRHGSGRIITVFGCGGDRDRGKRPMMGEAATRLSDFVIITSDNPRGEDPLEIIREIETGVTGRNYLTLPDREDAIKLAVKKAEAGDIVVIAGKGHEDYQEIKGVRRGFSDRGSAEAAIREKLSRGR